MSIRRSVWLSGVQTLEQTESDLKTAMEQRKTEVRERQYVKGGNM